MTPLYIAATKGRKETVEYLVENGAKINIKADSGVSIEILLLTVTVHILLIYRKHIGAIE